MTRVSAGPYTLDIPPSGVAILYEADGAGIDHQLPGGVGYLDALVQFAGEVIRLRAMVDGIRHPTGSEQFSSALSRLLAPVPWRLCDEEPGEILGADGGIVLTVDRARLTEQEAGELALWMILAVNTLAGLRAEMP